MAQNFNNFFNGDNSQTLANSPFIIARVISVVMGPYLEDGKTKNPDYNSITDLGKIRYVIVNSTQYHDLVGLGNKPARPFFSHVHEYPLNGEYVYIMPGPGLDLNDQAGDLDYYYIGPIKLWGQCHQNTFPDLASYAAYTSDMRADYETNRQGIRNNPQPGSMEYPAGYGFVSRNIKTLIPFVGDAIFEGRYGNSIRLGATVSTEYAKFNNWSSSGSVGTPITIIRNGQGNQSNKLGYVPTVEDVNVDQSSIYLTAGQQIFLDDLTNFPLTSWNVQIQSKVATAVTLTTPPQANATLSSQEQDLTTLPVNSVRGGLSSDTGSGESLGLSEEQLLAYDQEYVNFYNDYTTRTGELDDGFDAYFHFKVDNLPKITKQVKEWRVATVGVADSYTSYETETYPTLQSLYDRNPKLKQKVDEGKKIITLFEGPELFPDTEKRIRWDNITRVLLRRNRDKIKTRTN